MEKKDCIVEKVKAYSRYRDSTWLMCFNALALCILSSIISLCLFKLCICFIFFLLSICFYLVLRIVVLVEKISIKLNEEENSGSGSRSDAEDSKVM